MCKMSGSVTAMKSREKKKSEKHVFIEHTNTTYSLHIKFMLCINFSVILLVRNIQHFFLYASKAIENEFFLFFGKFSFISVDIYSTSLTTTVVVIAQQHLCCMYLLNNAFIDHSFVDDILLSILASVYNFLLLLLLIQLKSQIELTRFQFFFIFLDFYFRFYANVLVRYQRQQECKKKNCLTSSIFIQYQTHKKRKTLILRYKHCFSNFSVALHFSK